MSYDGGRDRKERYLPAQPACATHFDLAQQQDPSLCSKPLQSDTKTKATMTWELAMDAVTGLAFLWHGSVLLVPFPRLLQPLQLLTRVYHGHQSVAGRAPQFTAVCAVLRLVAVLTVILL